MPKPQPVERLVNRLKRFRRSATRYDTLQRVFRVAIHLACLMVLTK